MRSLSVPFWSARRKALAGGRQSFVATVLALLLLLTGCSTVFPRQKEVRVRKSKSSAAETNGVCVPGPSRRLPEFERLTYEMRWVGIRLGTLTMSIKGTEEICGRKAYVLEVTAKTNNFFSAIYRIDDRFTSYFDVEELYSLRHEVHRSEGNFRKDARTDFDQVNHKAYYVNFENNEKKEFEIPPRTQDTLTAGYYFRLLPLKLGDRVEYAVCNNEKNYKLLALIGTMVKTRLGEQLGELESFSVEPFAELRGERVEKGRVSAYYSWDERRLPLHAVIRAPVFTSVTVSLVSVEDGQEEKK